MNLDRADNQLTNVNLRPSEATNVTNHSKGDLVVVSIVIEGGVV